jgi:hypothetical protein
VRAVSYPPTCGRYRCRMSKAIERFLEAATVLGHPVDVRRFQEGTKTAPDAARAIGCEVGQIVKSLVFVADGEPLLALTSGANRVDVGRLATRAGASAARRADPEEARAATGFAVGGTPPFGYPNPSGRSWTPTCWCSGRSGRRRAPRTRCSGPRRPSSNGPPRPRSST